MVVDGEIVAHRLVTRIGARPVVTHAAWRTTADDAAAITLLASTASSRTPVPLGEAGAWLARRAPSAAGSGGDSSSANCSLWRRVGGVQAQT